MTTQKITIPEMLKKLDSLYDEEEKLKQQMYMLQQKYQQLKEDKIMLQNMIMYSSNKRSRK